MASGWPLSEAAARRRRRQRRSAAACAGRRGTGGPPGLCEQAVVAAPAGSRGVPLILDLRLTFHDIFKKAEAEFFDVLSGAVSPTNIMQIGGCAAMPCGGRARIRASWRSP